MFNYVDTKYTEIGEDVKIGNFSVVGTKGFHIAKNKWEMYKEDHPCKAILKDHVDLGEFNVVHRGRWRDTVIGEYTHTDSRVHISHNCHIGKRNVICTGATILGSVTTGDDCDIWSGAIIHQHVKIGNNCAIGANTYIRHDVPDNMVAYGNPVKIIPKSETKRYKEELT